MTWMRKTKAGQTKARWRIAKPPLDPIDLLDPLVLRNLLTHNTV